MERELRQWIEKIRLDEGDRAEILRYLAYGGQEMDDALQEQMKTCAAAINASAAPRCVCRAFSVEEEGAFPEELIFLEGRDIRHHLQGCDEVMLLAVTLGGDVDQAICRAQIRNVADALILDACGSVLVEKCCDALELALVKRAEEEGRYLTSRFSPGYGDLPIEAQARFAAVMDTARQIGLTVSASGILIPRKSVTAVLGASGSPVRKQTRSCANCNLAGICAFRKAGANCGR